MASGCFVTGTDTEIGKTLVTASLIVALRRRGINAVGMKPVAAGAVEVNGQPVNDDVEAIVTASGNHVDRRLVNPYLFTAPIAPHIAAGDEKRAIDPEKIVACHDRLSALHDVVVIEGVGGFRVPLSNGFDTADLACRLGRPVILVVGLRLGCINHALLTLEAIRARGLECLGWVANQIDPHMQRTEDNLLTLGRLLDLPRIGFIEHLAPPDPAVAASRLQVPPDLLPSLATRDQ